MSSALLQEARGFGAVVRKDLRDARPVAMYSLLALACGVASIGALYDVDPGVLDSDRRQAWMAVAALSAVPVVADAFAGEGGHAGTGWARPLPVRSSWIHVARVLRIALFGILAVSVAAVVDLVANHVFAGSDWREEVSSRLMTSSIIADERSALTTLVLSTAMVLGLTLRHALGSAVAAAALLTWCGYCLSRNSTPIVGDGLGNAIVATRALLIPVSAAGTSVLLTLFTAGVAFTIRGRRARTFLGRGASMLTAIVCAGAGALALEGDPLASREDALFGLGRTATYQVAPSPDGAHALVTLFHYDRRPTRSTWLIDTRTASRTRMTVPDDFGFGALGGLIDVDRPHWSWEGSFAAADYGRYTDLGPWDGPTGPLALEVESGRVGRPDAVGLTEVNRTPVWKSDVRERRDDGTVRDRWTIGGRDDEVEIVRGAGTNYWGARGAWHLVAYIAPDGGLRLLNLETREELDVPIGGVEGIRKVQLSAHHDRWVVVCDEHRQEHLVNAVTGERISLALGTSWSWTQRDSTPLLTWTPRDPVENDFYWTLVGPDGETELRLTEPVGTLVDLDGRRWLGWTKGLGAEAGRILTFDADGAALVVLRGEAIR